ncbi:MAG: 50S ribosomal protein L11 methyltransferase [Gammaproteobacteria bacterium]|nr:50S ribosomal protein L11 methyltransferase [Gammaproteobacteria bacterium]
MPWIRVSVAVPGSEGEAAGAWLETVGAVAVTWCDAGEAPVFEPLPDALPDLAAWPHVRAVGLFGLDADLGGVRSGFRGREVGIDFVGDEDWKGNWRRYAEMRRFGRLTVTPSHLEPPGTDSTVLRLDPGGAFGTGAHPTTRLCLAWLAGQPLAGCAVLDYGCGSGILAIAAALLGARATAVDHDAQALDVTRRNALANGITLEVRPPGDFAARGYDVVVANILAGTLVAEAVRLQEALRPGGRVALAGILEHQVDAVVAAYPAIAFDTPRAMAGWVLLHGGRG